MFPASTTKLRPGDVCFIPRADGSYVPFVFVCTPAKSRNAFYGALGSARVEAPTIDLLPPTLTLLKPALVHVSCYKENNTPVVGNVAERVGQQTLQAAAAAVNSSALGSASKVWGYNTIVKYANAVA